MRVLLFNPNRSAHITQRMAASAQAALAPGDSLQVATAAGGPWVVRDPATLAEAEANAWRELPALLPGVDALLWAISLDGLADALRAHFAPRPVLGMTEAAVAAAAAGGRHVGLLTLGPALLPLYRARLQALLPPARIAALQAPDLPLAFEAASAGVQPAVLAGLLPAALALRAQGAEAIVLAGAVLCGYDAALQAELGLPVYDGVACAVRQLSSR